MEPCSAQSVWEPSSAASAPIVCKALSSGCHRNRAPLNAAIWAPLLQSTPFSNHPDSKLEGETFQK